MSSQESDITRRIPDNLGGTDTIFDNAPIVGAVQASDGFVAFGPALFLLFVFENILPSSLSIIGFIISGFAAFVGVLALLIKPSYLTLGQWISDIRRFRNAPDTYRKALPNGEGADDTDGSVDSIEINSNRDTREKIDLERIYPQYGAIERPDDTVVGIVRVRGLNLDSATQRTINQKIQQFDNLVNQNLKNDIQLYMPMRQFDPTKQIDMYEDRLEDSEIFQNDPLLQEYISDRISFITAMSMGSYIRRFYVVCEVPRQEVITDEAQAGEMKRALEQVPPRGLWSQLYIAIKGGRLTTLNDDELKTRQLEQLEERRNEISNLFSGHLGCKTETLDADSVGVLLKEFWEGVHVNEDEEDGFIRRSPFVKGETDKQRMEEVDEEKIEDREF